MLEYQDRTVREVAACTCDRCQRRMTPDDYDWHEKLSIAYEVVSVQYSATVAISASIYASSASRKLSAHGFG
jgi:hypothetical protein